MIDYNSHNWSTFVRWRGSVLPWACMYSLFPATLAYILKHLDNEEYVKFSQWQLISRDAAFSGFTWTVGFILVFRTNKCYSRFWACATGICTMRTQMYEAASSLVSFTVMSKAQKKEIDVFRHKIIRLFSLMHAMTLVAIADQNDHYYPIVDIESIPDKYLTILKSKNRRQKPEIVYQWINHTIIRAIDTGLLNIPPPILSRVFQELEKAMVEYNQVMQIMTIHFPFPYAQFCVVGICLYSIFAPFVMIAWVNQPIMGALFCFIVSACYFSLELIAAELENPFGDDWNDLPCRTFQDDMNEGLVLLMEPSANSEFNLGQRIATHKQLVEERSTWLSFEEISENHHIVENTEEWSDDEGFIKMSPRPGEPPAASIVKLAPLEKKSAPLEKKSAPPESKERSSSESGGHVEIQSVSVVAQQEVLPDRKIAKAASVLPASVLPASLEPSLSKPPVPIRPVAKDHDALDLSGDIQDSDEVDMPHREIYCAHSRNTPAMMKLAQILDIAAQCRDWLTRIHTSLERSPSGKSNCFQKEASI